MDVEELRFLRVSQRMHRLPTVCGQAKFFRVS